MTFFQSIILGLIQGITEFLPISSSGHLIVFPQIFGWKEQPLVFDTTMHLATSLALISFFWKDLLEIFSSSLKDFLKHKFIFNQYTINGKKGLAVIIGTIPAALLGFFLDNFFESLFRGITSVAIFLILGSFLMVVAEKAKHTDSEITIKKGLGIGLFQSLALFPGISRSGSTISGGMILGLNRETAARFSFIISIPIVLSAGLFQLVRTSGNLDIPFTILTIGFITAYISGLLAIKFLLKFVRSHTLYPFIFYRIILAILLLVVVYL